ncbi:MAG: carbohydrate porin [Deltaproteobacteria bacterium]|nr:carbohydrate porin [Deltaproteobacteria bacterium]
MRSIRIVKALALLTVVSVASSAQAADERLSMFGYFRVSQGAQLSGNKGQQTFYGLSGAPAKFRLGNENDWMEFGFNLLAFKGEDGTIGHAVIMLGGNYDPNHIGVWGTSFAGWEGNYSAKIQQLYVDLTKIPGLDATLWAGSKFYKREYSGINDLFYWSHQGYGAGIEDIAVGEKAKVSYAIMNAGSSDAHAGYLHDLRVKAGIIEGGSIQAGVMVVTPIAAKHDDLDVAFGGVVQYVQNVMGGNNQLAFEYGTGAVANGSFGANGGLELSRPKEISKMRVIDNLNINPMPGLNLEVVGIYEMNKDSDADVTVTAIEFGGRVTYAVAKHVQLLLEAGFDQVTPDEGDAANLIKITPAIEICSNPGGVPRIRLYATYATWNDAAKGSVKGGASGIGPRPDDSNGLQIGIQGEAWF